MMRSIVLAVSIAFMPMICEAETFRVSSERFAIEEDFDAQARSMFGPEFRLAEWESVKDLYASEGGAFLKEAGLVRRDEEGPSSGAVTVDGERFHRGGPRQYFVAWGHVPSSFLVHDRAVYQGVPLNLGSWYTDRRILAVSPEHVIKEVVSDRTMWTWLGALQTGLASMGFSDGATAINFVTGAAEVSVAVQGKDPEAVRRELADAVVSFMPIATRSATNVMGVISEPVMVDGELMVRVTLPFHFLRTGDPSALDCGKDNPECRF